jgi:CMP-N-acetylneuraminic acid synthetase
MNIYALQTARAGSKSVPSKNILEIQGKPLYLHNVDAAIGCEKIQDVYISTDCPYIKGNYNKKEYKILNRSKHLCGDNASHHEVMINSLYQIEDEIEAKVDILVVLLGNSMGASSQDLNKAIKILLENKEADSVQSVSEFNMFNPFRALKINNNKLESIIPQDEIEKQSKIKNINDKNSCGEVYFFNGSFWVCKRDAILGKGLLPFPWLGYNIIPYIQDTVFELDASWQIINMQSQ